MDVMKIEMSVTKKAQFYNIFLVIIVVFALIFMFYRFDQKYRSFEDDIGYKPLEVINISQRAENLMSQLIDFSAKYSAYQGIYETAKKGGFHEAPCGNYLGYSLWINEEHECFTNMSALRKSLNHYINEYMDEYATDFRGMSSDNYNIQIDKKTEQTKKFLDIRGFAYQPLVLNIYGLRAGAEFSLSTGFLQIPSERGARIGLYAVQPNFRTKVYYDIESYAVLKTSLNNMISLCENNENFYECLIQEVISINNQQQTQATNQGSQTTTVLQWSMDCPYEKYFHSVIDYIEDCAHYIDKDCYCGKPAQLNTGTFKLEKSQEDVDITNINNMQNQENYGTKLMSQLAQDTINFNPMNHYLKKDSLGRLTVQTGTVGQICTQKLPKRKARFCVESSETLPVYDSTTEFHNIEYRFAIFAPDKTPPKPVNKISVRDNDISEDSIIVKWEISPDLDVDHYKIYYRETDIPLTDISGVDWIKVETKHIPSQYNYINIVLDNINPANERFAEYRTINEDGKDYERLEREKVYYLRKHRVTPEYLYLTNVQGIEDGNKYAIAVTPVDFYGNENKEIRMSLVVEAEDDLAPERVNLKSANYVPQTKKIVLLWDKPTTNTDGSALKVDNFNDDYEIYYKKTTDEITDINDLIQVSDLIIVINVQNNEVRVDIDVSDENVFSPGSYRIAVTAIDTYGNEYKNTQSRQVEIN